MSKEEAKITVTVRFVGILRAISGKSMLPMKLEKTVSLREVVRKIVEDLPRLRRTLVDPEQDDPRPKVLIIVNDREISVLNGLETLLTDGDEVVFVPFTHGG